MRGRRIEHKSRKQDEGDLGGGGGEWWSEKL